LHFKIAVAVKAAFSQKRFLAVVVVVLVVV
jgi:hypothetical protein